MAPEVADSPPQLRLPSFEGKTPTRQVLMVSGEIPVNNQALIDDLKLDREVELTITIRGRVDKRTHTIKRDKDGYVVEIVSGAKVTVEASSIE